MNRSAVFVTGTGTEVGKTVVTGLIARYLQDHGKTVITQKWIQTGGAGFPTDIASHLQIMHQTKDSIQPYQHDVCPYQFSYPASPHLAARKAKAAVRKQKIISSLRRLEKKFDYVIIEGVGGALVPYTSKALVIDIVQQLQIPTVIVAGNVLGAINHTLLTVEALRSRNIPIIGIIFNNCQPDQPADIVADNPKIISLFTKAPNLGSLPYNTNYDNLYIQFQPIGAEICKKKL